MQTKFLSLETLESSLPQ